MRAKTGIERILARYQGQAKPKQSNTLSAALRKKVNADFIGVGLDGTKMFSSRGMANGTIASVLGHHGIALVDGMFDGHRFGQKQGHVSLLVGKMLDRHGDRVAEYENTLLVVQWYTHTTGRVECIAYLS